MQLNYEGLGEPSGTELRPYLNLKSEGYSITDAVVATRNWLGNKVSRKWVTIGHSQGGQAALGAAQYADRANLDYKGTIAVAPSSQLNLILNNPGEPGDANATIDQHILYAYLDTFTALVVAGLRNSNPTLDYSQVFKVPTDAIAKNAESVCLDTLAIQFYDAMTQYFRLNWSLKNYPRKTDTFMYSPVIQTFLNKDSQPLQVQVKTPVIIYQGGADVIVPQVATDTLYGTAKALGTSVNYITDPAWDHNTAYALNIDNIVADVKEMFAAQ